MESLKLYEELINKNGSRKVLFLVENGFKKKEYIHNLEGEFYEELKITTYLNFVKSELKKYWPLVKDNKNIEPTFVNNTFVEFFITKKVREYRLEKEYFYDITSSNKNIAKNIISNIKYLIESNNYSKNALSKIYEYKKDKVSEIIFSNMWDIMNEYFEEFIKNEILDDNLCLYLYNNYLLKNEKYKAILDKIDCVLVDSIEKSTTCEIDFLIECRNVIGFFDQSKDYSMYKNTDINYIKENLFDRDNVEIINKEIDCTINSDKIDIYDDTILFDEMVESVVKKVYELINNGYNKGDIALIVPINNNIFEENIKSFYSKKYKENEQVFNNIKNTNKLIDNSYVNAIFVALSIYLNGEEVLNDFEYINFIEIMFDVNKIEARKIYKSEEFIELKNEIKSYENKEVFEFLQEFYLQRIINMKHGKENIQTVRKLIFESESFIKNYKIIDDTFNNKHFLEVIRDFLNDYKLTSELKNIDEYVLISSPISYLNSNQKRKVIIMFDLDSYNFSIDKNLSNMIITRKSFNTIYSQEIENKYKKYYINNLICNLVNNCEKFYGFKSEYSMQGYNELSDLYEFLLEIKN